MGREIELTTFTEQDYNHYTERLYDCLNALKQTINREGFGQGPVTLGAEFETYIVNRSGTVAPINQQLLAELKDDQFQHELNKFNLEYNLSPVAAKGNPFSKMEQEADQALLKAIATAEPHNATIVPIGILPTLQFKNLQAEYMTDVGRYHMLFKGLQKLRGESFKVNINGINPIKLECDHVTLEGANTSFQVHLRVEPEKFADSYNATQLMTPLVLALSANSPTLLGHRLWQETRIALFKQATDSRRRGDVQWREPARVSFGHGWVRQNAWELFAETVALYPSIIPVISDQDPLLALKNDFPPDLDELNLHMGTTWPWNRAVYASSDGGHLRIEMRSIPSGPTTFDMMTNAALFIGLTVALRRHINDVLPSMPFRFAEYNFYRAAQDGLDAKILWPVKGQYHPIEKPINDVILSLLPLMEEGLSELGVDMDEIKKHRENVENRLKLGITGAQWQLNMLEKYEKMNLNQEESYRQMTLNYIEQQKRGKPLIEWSLNP